MESTLNYSEKVRLHFGDQVHRATVITFGCQQNEADSEKIRGMAIDMGYTLTDNTDEADLIVINTCAVRRLAEMKALSLLGRFKALKKKNPDLIIGVLGCMAAEESIANMLKTDFHYVSFSLEPSLIHEFPRMVYTKLCLSKRTFLFGMDDGSLVEGITKVRQSNFKAWVSIMHGCNNFCSYCIVPYVRGRERSRDSSLIIEECSELIGKGVKEITLLGQNVNSYSSDMDFADLLRSICMIKGDFWVRFMTSHPKDVSKKLCDVLSEFPDKIAPAFHLPLQSGSDRILKLMNRTYDMEHYLATVEMIKNSIPDVALTSDIIVGFPGETEEDFEKTLKAVKEVSFDMLYAFVYSKRDGTPAAKMYDPTPEDQKSTRIERLIALSAEIAYEKNRPLLGKTLKVLCDSPDKKGGDHNYVGRSGQGKLVHFLSASDVTGKFVQVKINRIGAFDLFGEIVN